MRTQRFNPYTTGAVTAVVLLVITALIFVSGIPAGPQIPGPWNQKTTLRVQLADADALAPHASVEIAGVKIGEVQSVAAHGNLAVATLQIQNQYADIHRDATVFLRAHGLFGPKYISIVPGTANAPVLHDGETVSVTRTVQPVDLDAILQDLQAPEQQNLRTLFVELGLAAAGRGNDAHHLFAAASSLSQVLDAPLKKVGAVAPQLDAMLVDDEAFNAYFAQPPLDQLVANSETTFKAFADNSATLQALLDHADSTLTSLDTILNGQAGNLTSIIQSLGKQGGAVDQLNRFTYLLSLFGANLTGNERNVGTDPASIPVTNDIIAAIQNVSSAFYYSDAGLSVCPATPAPAGTNDNHCTVASYLGQHGIGDSTLHFLHVLLYRWPTPNLPNTCNPLCPSGQARGPEGSSGTQAGDQMLGFGSWMAA